MKRKHDYEQILADQIKGAGYRFIREYLFAAPMRKWRADFFLPDFSLIVEVDGVLYRGKGRHQTAAGFENDIQKANFCVLRRLAVLRFTPKMVLGTATWGKAKHPVPAAIETIKEFCERLDK